MTWAFEPEFSKELEDLMGVRGPVFERRRNLTLVAVCSVGLSLLAIGGCVPSTDGAALELREVGEVMLEERDSVVNAHVRLRPSGGGELVVADPVEGKIRVYDQQGGLLRQFGRKGEGPGEFMLPLAAAKVNSAIWVLDFQRGVSKWSFPEGRLVDTWEPAVDVSLGLLPLGDSMLVIGGLTPYETPWRLLRILDPRRNAVMDPFFELEVPVERRPLAMSFQPGIPMDLLEDGSLIAVFSWSDTARVFTLPKGQFRESLPLRIPGFTYEGNVPDPATRARLKLVTAIHAVPEDRLLVQYTIYTEPEEQHGLLLQTLGGDLLFEQFPSGRLLGERWPDLYFADPSGLRPERLLVQRLVPGEG